MTTASTGFFMVLLLLAGFVFSLYSALAHLDLWWLLNVCLSVSLIVFIGLATVPAWQLASLQTKILKHNSPAIIVDQNGIQDNASNYAFGFIPWSEVETVTLTSRYAPNIKKTFSGIAIVLKNKDMLLRKKSKLFAMWLMADDEVKKKRQVFIPQDRIARPIEEVVEQINNFRARMTQ
ncbi:MAG: STM3941 family protein [Janthinobacterium lividum]